MKSILSLLLTILVLMASSSSNAPGAVQAAFAPVFLGNSGVMYEQVCQATPFFVRSLTRNAILSEMQVRGYQEGVTEDQFYQIIQDVTPKKFLDRTLSILDRHKSN